MLDDQTESANQDGTENQNGSGDGGVAKGRKPWYRDPPRLASVIAALVAATIGLTQLIGPLLQDDPPDVSAEYILDVSRGMSGRVGQKPKLRAVEAEILTHVTNTPSRATALRLAGPSCSSGYREPDVPFAEGNGDEFRDELEQVEAAGDSDFASAMSHAVEDYLRDDEAASSKSKTVFVFVGGPDTCSRNPEAIMKRALRDLSVRRKVEISLKFVGVKAPRPVRRILRSTRREAASLGYSTELVYADKPGELADVLPGEEGGPPDDQYGEQD
jgi:hypothetical protein